MQMLAGNAFFARRLVLDQERRDEGARWKGLRKSPAQLVPAGTDALAGRDLHLDAGLAERLPVARQIVRLHAEIDETSALLRGLPPAMLRIFLLEGDQLDIGTVSEGDQRIVRTSRMRAAGNDSEAELGIVADRDLQIRKHDHEVINRLHGHAGQSARGNNLLLPQPRRREANGQTNTVPITLGDGGWGQDRDRAFQSEGAAS